MSVILLEADLPASTGTGLTSSKCYELAIAARCLPGHWDVQWDKDDQGHLSLALLQDDYGVVGAAGVYLVWREDSRLRLGFGRDDTYLNLGVHADVESIMDTIRGVLERTADKAGTKTVAGS